MHIHQLPEIRRMQDLDPYQSAQQRALDILYQHVAPPKQEEKSMFKRVWNSIFGKKPANPNPNPWTLYDGSPDFKPASAPFRQPIQPSPPPPPSAEQRILQMVSDAFTTSFIPRAEALEGRVESIKASINQEHQFRTKAAFSASKQALETASHTRKKLDELEAHFHLFAAQAEPPKRYVATVSSLVGKTKKKANADNARPPKRKGKPRKYQRRTVEAAVRQICSGKMDYTDAEAKYGLPRGYLYGRVYQARQAA